MPWEPIRKTSSDWRVVPNLVDYERACAEFSWGQARAAWSIGSASHRACPGGPLGKHDDLLDPAAFGAAYLLDARQTRMWFIAGR